MAFALLAPLAAVAGCDPQADGGSISSGGPWMRTQNFKADESERSRQVSMSIKGMA
jgi:hypothetical protein